MENSNPALPDADTINDFDSSNNELSTLKISACTKEQLLEMMAILEAELQARDITVAALQNDKLRHMLYDAKYGRGCLDDPYLALERDGAVLGEDLDEDMLMRAAHEAKLIHLDNLLVAQHNLVDKIRGQVQLYQTRYSDVCRELDDERKKIKGGPPEAMAGGVEANAVNEELVFERSCVESYREDLALMFSVVEAMRNDVTKHKQVALMLIKERKLLAECLLKDRQRLKEMEDAALHDDKTAMERAYEDKLTKLALERTTLEDRLRREEAMGKATRLECDRLRQQVDFLQGQLQQQVQLIGQAVRQPSPIALSTPDSRPSSVSTSSLRNVVTVPAATPATYSITSRVPIDNAPTLAQRALSPSSAALYSYRSPTSPGVPQSAPVPRPSSATPVIPTTAPSAAVTPRLNMIPGQSAVLTTSSGQRISLHVSPSKTPNSNPGSANSSPMVVQVSQSPSPSIPSRPISTPSAVRPATPSSQRLAPTPLSPANNNSVAISSSFNITIRPDSKGISTFVGANASSTPPEPPARLNMGKSFPSPASASTSYQLDSPTESGRYLTIKKMGVATSHSINN